MAWDPVDDMSVLHGDTREHPMGIGTFGSRSIAVDGAATFEAAKRSRTKRPRSLLISSRASPRTSSSSGGAIRGRLTEEER